MHELSIVQNLIELASEGAAREGSNCVRKINVRIGALAGVDYDALQFSFELASEGTPCEGAVLEVERVPATAMCPRCQRPQPLSDAYVMNCPECGGPVDGLLSGQELDLISLEIPDDAAACA
jgi:hydrogenase nickel incorporation protein HypA/HybF